MNYRRKSELTILSYNSSDAGRYECRAKNKAGILPVRAQIVVENPPGEPTEKTGKCKAE